ncbi:MAG: efflux RND transporter periplasmic adaptor subunit [Gammaproteobacteria bacterium]|nr:efflux RND transporter periplasmic adaptor subunit [Gammaproteobacteria bacterium]
MTRKILPLFILVFITAGLAWMAEWRIGASGQDISNRRDQPPVVETVLVSMQPMPLTLQSVGQVQPELSVQIRPQVSGVLQKLHFVEGQTVIKEQRLFSIDRAQYDNSLVAARAEWENAKVQAQRLAPLADKEYVTGQEYDNALAAQDQAMGRLKQAEINLAYTEIRAPITGLTGIIGAKPGNLVAPGDSVPLVVINQMRPILVQFTIPQQRILELRRYQAQRSIRVFITHEDGSGNLDDGELIFIDNVVNTGTGTVLLKARVENEHEQLWPGQYVGVQIRFTIQPEAVVIPQSAVQIGQKGNYVYVVEQDRAEIRDVHVDRQVGDLAVIASGLKSGETVIKGAPRNLTPGSKVVISGPPKE